MTTDQLIYLILGGAGLGLFVAACGSWLFRDPDWHSGLKQPPGGDGPDPDGEPVMPEELDELEADARELAERESRAQTETRQRFLGSLARRHRFQPRR